MDKVIQELLLQEHQAWSDGNDIAQKIHDVIEYLNERYPFEGLANSGEKKGA